MPGAVCAVVRSSQPAALTAIAAQTRKPDAVVAHDGSWHGAVAAGAADGADWLWLLEAGVTPQPQALERLLASLADLADLRQPVLLASKVTTPSGQLHPDSAPWIPLLDRASVIAAARCHLASIRLARWGSLLVHRGALALHGLPREDYADGADDLEWTARLLRDGGGYLVPGSVAVRDTPVRAPALSSREVRDRVRMVRGDGWVGPEPAWFALMLGVDALGDLRTTPHPRTVRRLLRGVSSGLSRRSAA